MGKAWPISAAGRAGLERNFLVVLDLRRAAAAAAGRGAAAARLRLAVAAAAVVPAAATASFIAAAIEHLHRVGHDLRPVLLLARLLVVPAVCADRALDVNELALL